MAQDAAPIVVIGDALIDEIRDGRGVRELVGGAALNVAVGVRRLGHPSTLIAMVGSDAAGDRIRTYLDDHRVGLISHRAPHGSARATVTWAAPGEPRYAFNRAAQERGIRYSEAARAAISTAPLVVVSGFPFDAPAEVAALREALGDARLLVDPNPRAGMLRDAAAFAAGVESLVPGAIVKVSTDDARLLYDSELAGVTEHLLTVGAVAVVATDGAAGAALAWDGVRMHARPPEMPAPVVDTVGAGDAVVAVFAAGCAQSDAAAALLLHGAAAEAPGEGRSASCVVSAREDAGTRAPNAALLERAMAVAAATCRGAGGLLRTPESLDGGAMERAQT